MEEQVAKVGFSEVRPIKKASNWLFDAFFRTANSLLLFFIYYHKKTNNELATIKPATTTR